MSNSYSVAIRAEPEEWKLDFRKFKLSRRSFYFFTGATALFFTALFIWQMFRLLELEERLDQIDRIMIHAIVLEELFVDAETGMRGYLLSHSADSLKPYQQAAARFQLTVDESLRLARREPNQQARIREVGDLFNDWFAHSESAIKKGHGADVSKYFSDGEGSRIITKCRSRISEVISTEQIERDRQVKQLHWQIPRAIAGGAGISFFLRILLAFTLRQLRKTERYERILKRFSRRRDGTIETPP